MVEYIKVAVKALRLNKVRSFLTMLGVIIGVGAVIILTSIVGGLENTIKEQFESFGSNTLYLFPGTPGGARGPGGSTVNKLEFDFAEKIRRLPGVDDVSIMVFFNGDIKFKNNESNNAIVQGVEENYLAVSSLSTETGRFFRRSEVTGGRMVTVIGTTVAENLFGKSSPLGKEISIKGRKFTVIGVIEERGAVFGQDQDNEVYIPLNVARQRFQVERPNFFFIRVIDSTNIRQVKREIEQVILKNLDADEFSVLSQEQSLNFISEILGVLATALGGIAAISLLVGGVGIMNIMFVSVTERTREIGLRKAVGADSRSILVQFLCEAVILSLLGGILGVIFGIGASLAVGTFIDTAPNIVYVVLAFVVAAVIGIVFGVAPAIKASKLDPIVALRYE